MANNDTTTTNRNELEQQQQQQQLAKTADNSLLQFAIFFREYLQWKIWLMGYVEPGIEI